MQPPPDDDSWIAMEDLSRHASQRAGVSGRLPRSLKARHRRADSETDERPNLNWINRVLLRNAVNSINRAEKNAQVATPTGEPPEEPTRER